MEEDERIFAYVNEPENVLFFSHRLYMPHSFFTGGNHESKKRKKTESD